jgi:hypothetical protein
VSEALDHADSLAPGHGRVDLFASADQQFVGGGLDYSHRLTPAMSAFARGWAGWQNEPGGWRSDVGAMGGLRWQW